MSESKIPTLKPILFKLIAMFDVIVDFPTPPFPDEIATIFLIFFNDLPLIVG